MKKRVIYNAFLFAFFIWILSAGCHTPDSYFIVGNNEEQRVLKSLLNKFDKLQANPDASPETKFMLIKLISEYLSQAGYKERQITFLTQYVEQNATDPYNSYYLALAAGAYKELGATPFAIHYYERILKNYSDITVLGNSIHYMCLKELLNNAVCKEYLIEYYKEIISRFEENIDVGAYYYYLAKAYEDIGDWDLAMQTYKQFLTYPDTFIMGNPDALEETRKKVAFYDVKKTWLADDLTVLVNTIKTALNTGNVTLLNKYKAKINFFSKYWNQKDYDKSLTEKVFNIGNFLVKSRVYYRNELESESNANEAYLKTTGWYYYVSTWYFYFRRINFAADPEVDGKWEWVGIYFGEKS